MRGRDALGRKGCLVFNGEFYNHRQLRRSLADAYQFSSSSDSEVLLAGLLRDGPSFLPQMNAMMAFAFCNETQGLVILGRDRLGKKPLYIYEGQDFFAFASEIKAFHKLGLQLTEDSKAWAYYHWVRHVPGLRTVYREVSKFPAGSFASLDISRPEMPTLAPQLFWDPFSACDRSFDGSYSEALDQFLELLDDATRLRLDADVPVGVFLSGGIDSSLVASSVARLANNRVAAYIYQSQDPESDESPIALKTARRLGLQHRIIQLRDDDFARQVRLAPYFYDDPCAPLSQLATMALSEAASREVKVILTGDGGDELFLGYPWTQHPRFLWRIRRIVERVPGLKSLVCFLLKTRVGIRLLRILVKFTGFNAANLEHKIAIALHTLTSEAPGDLYEHFLEINPRSALPSVEKAQLGDLSFTQRIQNIYPGYSWSSAKARTLEEFLAALELVSVMRDEILVKVDRGTMAYSVEARSPLLDFRIVEFALSLKASFKASGDVFKRLLRDACERRLGGELARLKKRGFAVSLRPGSELSKYSNGWERAFEQGWRTTWAEGDSRPFPEMPHRKVPS